MRDDATCAILLRFLVVFILFIALCPSLYTRFLFGECFVDVCADIGESFAGAMVAVRGIFGAHFTDDVCDARRNETGDFERRIDLFIGDAHEVFAVESDFARQHFVIDEPSGIEVGFATRLGFARKEFGCHIRWRTAHAPLLREQGLALLEIVVDRGNAEIEDANFVGRWCVEHHDIARFDVAVDDVFRMRFFEGFEELFDDTRRMG